MDFSEILNNDFFTWVLLPILIFISRVLDVSLGTMRLIFVSKGYKLLAPVLGFFEVLIWLVAIGQIMQHLDNIFCYLAYGLGFATGNFVGIYLEEKMSIGTVIIRVIPKKDTSKLIGKLREQNYGVSASDIEGMTGKVKMFFSIINRKELKNYIEIVNKFNPHSFYTVEDIRASKEGYFKAGKKLISFNPINHFRRKGK